MTLEEYQRFTLWAKPEEGRNRKFHAPTLSEATAVAKAMVDYGKIGRKRSPIIHVTIAEGGVVVGEHAKKKTGCPVCGDTRAFEEADGWACPGCGTI